MALDTYQLMRVDGCTPNVVTYNTLIDVYGGWACGARRGGARRGGDGAGRGAGWRRERRPSPP